MIKESGIVKKLRALMDGAKKLYNEPPNDGDMWFFELFHALDEAATLIAELQAEVKLLGKMAAPPDLVAFVESTNRIQEAADEFRKCALAAESSLHRVRGETIETEIDRRLFPIKASRKSCFINDGQNRAIAEMCDRPDREQWAALIANSVNAGLGIKTSFEQKPSLRVEPSSDQSSLSMGRVNAGL